MPNVSAETNHKYKFLNMTKQFLIPCFIAIFGTIICIYLYDQKYYNEYFIRKYNRAAAM